MSIQHVSGGLSIVSADVARQMQEDASRGYLVPYEPKPIRNLSERLQVYIYNAGPFPQTIDMGSMGSARLGAVSGEEFMSGAVSAPVVIPGIPSEVYPSVDLVGIGVRHYYRPSGKNATEDNPGLSMALEVISDIVKAGIFVSTTNDQSSAEFIEKRDQARLWAKERASQVCEGYDQQYLKRSATQRPFKLFGVAHDPATMAIVAGRPQEECPWLPIYQVLLKD